MIEFTITCNTEDSDAIEMALGDVEITDYHRRSDGTTVLTCEIDDGEEEEG